MASKDKVIKLNIAEKFLYDMIECSYRPDAMGTMSFDLTATNEYRKRYEEKKGVHLSLTHLTVKACALAMLKYPKMSYMRSKYTFIQPSSMDIGVSVAADLNIAPTVVIKSAERKSLDVIAEELKTKSAEIDRKIRDFMKLVNTLGRFVPGKFFRHRIIRRSMRNWKLNRETIGIFQITSPGKFGVELSMTNVFATTGLLAINAIQDKLVLINGRLENRPYVTFSLHIDHRVMDAAYGAKFLAEVIRLIKNPEEMEPLE